MTGKNFRATRTALILLSVFCSAVAGRAPARAAAAPAPRWPTLAEQLRGVTPGSALEQLIRSHQDFSLLRPDEATDELGLPPWLRVLWRQAHPELVYAQDGATGGYPLILHEIGEWMLYHQDLLPGKREPDRVSRLLLSSSPDLRISGLRSSPRSESDIRVHFRDPSRIIAASNDIETSGTQAQFYSTDGGATWGQTSLSLFGADTFHGDPAVDWTSDGTAWATTLGIRPIDPFSNSVLVRAYKSTDSGATWAFDGTVSGSQTTTDKPMLWADHAASSPHKDNLYVIWINGPAVYVGTRTPGSSGSWGSPLQIDLGSGFNGVPGADVKTNSAGDVFAFWPGFDPTASGDQRILVNRSTDGALSFQPAVTVAHTFGRYQFGIPAQAVRRLLLYVSAGAFRTPSQSFVYAVWNDLSGAPGCTTTTNAPGANPTSPCKTRIWFTRSTDGGATWASPVKVNDLSSLDDQFYPHLAVDETTGALALTYYDTVNDVNRKLANVWYQSSFDNGATWSAAVRVTTAPTDETASGADLNNQYGDYTGLSGYFGKFFPSWTDRRNTSSREEIWSAAILDGCPGCGEAAAFVSVNGKDSNDCGRLTPCRTFAGALANVPAGSEIDVLDSGDFGPVALTKAISLVAARALGGIEVGSGSAITVNAGASDKVVLRGLTLEGLGTGANGITFTAGGSLYVENCTINGFGGYGIEFAPTSGSGRLFVLDTVIRNNGTGATGGGLHLLASTGPGFVATVDGLRTENNVFGLRAENLGLVTVRHSLAAHNGFTGFSAVNTSGSGTLRMVIENSVATANGTNGVLTSGLATAALSNTVVTGNATGLNGTGGPISSFHNNRVWGNGLDQTGTIQLVTDR